ncbi:MAG: hypothetical protein H6Q67_1596 [Firmicutes bacterium]|nr:hypothetical protein [Bacillota bacterium]
MIDISTSSLVYFAWSIFIWLLDSLLNFVLAKKMGDTANPLIYFIPFYGYYHFGVFIGIHPIVIIPALISGVAAPLLILNPIGDFITLIAKLGNAIVVYFTAKRLKKAQWLYSVISFCLGLVSIPLQLLIVLVGFNADSYLLIFILLLLLSTVGQIPKIVLAIHSAESSKLVQHK